jgi:ABC-type multidrug transport system fused ATPase/permease subunit
MWVTLTNDPRHLSALHHFQVLHEIGHCNGPATIVAANGTASVFSVQVAALPFILWMTAWQPLTSAWAVIYLLAMFVCCAATELSRRYGWLCDEMLADFYALQRFRIEWFDQYPASSLFSYLTREKPPAVATWVPRVLLRLVRAEELLSPTRQQEIRRAVLLRSLERMRQGERPVAPDPPVSMNNTVRLANLSGYTLAIAAFCLGLNAVPPSGAQMIILVVVMAVVVALALLILQSNRMLADLVDSRLAGRPLAADVETAIQEYREARAKKRERSEQP